MSAACNIGDGWLGASAPCPGAGPASCACTHPVSLGLVDGEPFAMAFAVAAFVSDHQCVGVLTPSNGVGALNEVLETLLLGQMSHALVGATLPLPKSGGAHRSEQDRHVVSDDRVDDLVENGDAARAPTPAHFSRPSNSG